jgi:hypothetical protein
MASSSLRTKLEEFSSVLSKAKKIISLIRAGVTFLLFEVRVDYGEHGVLWNWQHQRFSLPIPLLLGSSTTTKCNNNVKIEANISLL